MRLSLDYPRHVDTLSFNRGALTWVFRKTFKIKMVEFTGPEENIVIFQLTSSSHPWPHSLSCAHHAEKAACWAGPQSRTASRPTPEISLVDPRKADRWPLLTRMFAASSRSLFRQSSCFVAGPHCDGPGAAPTAGHCVPVSWSPDSGCLRSPPTSGAGGLHPVPTQWMLQALTHRKRSSHVLRTDDWLTMRRKPTCLKSTPAAATARR